MGYEVKKLTIEKVVERENCIGLDFKEIGYVVFSKDRFDEEFLPNLKVGRNVYATIEKAHVPCIQELKLLHPEVIIYKSL